MRALASGKDELPQPLPPSPRWPPILSVKDGPLYQPLALHSLSKGWTTPSPCPSPLPSDVALALIEVYQGTGWAEALGLVISARARALI